MERGRERCVLTNEKALAPLLRAICRVAEGSARVRSAADIRRRHMSTSRVCAAALTLASVLRDTRSFSVLGGRPDAPRSLGSVHAAAVLRFCGSTFRARKRRFTPLGDLGSVEHCFALTRDGKTLLMTNTRTYDEDAILAIDVESGALVQSVGRCSGSKRDIRPLDFNKAQHIYVAEDDFVFVADCGNDRIQILTPRLGFHAFVGRGELHRPVGVCADANAVFVSQSGYLKGPELCIKMFGRRDGTLRRVFGHAQLTNPLGLCFASRNRRVVVADNSARYGGIAIFSREGVFKRTLCGGQKDEPAARRVTSVACTDADEIVVHDEKHGLLVFSDVTENCRVNNISKPFDTGDADGVYNGVALRADGTVLTTCTTYATYATVDIVEIE
jgi:hypothetical protein